MTKAESKIKHQESSRALLVDFGGVLGLPNRHRDPFTNFILDHHLRSTEFAKHIGPLFHRWMAGEINLNQVWDAIEYAFNLNAHRSNYTSTKLINFVTLNHKLLKLIDRAKRQGWQTAIVSNNYREWFNVWVKDFKLAPHFDLLINSAEVGLVKPGKEIYQLTCRELGVKPADCLFIDNELPNIQTAQKLGMQTVFYSHPKSLKEIKKLLKPS